MNLEQRVNALEQEVQLLKAQIQTTLLVIQEQLLNNTYPTLSMPESASKPASEAQPATNGPKKVFIAGVEPVQDPEPEEIKQVAPAPPAVRSGVIIEETPQPNQFAVEKWNDTAPPASESNNLDWFELDNWVSQKVETLGINKTRELINLYAQRERFSLPERELLMQFINIYDSEKTEKTEKVDKAPNGNGNHRVANPSPESVPAKLAPLTRSVVEEIRAEQQKSTDSSAILENGNHPFTKRQELVLRLIAGILSAGDEPEAPAPEPISLKGARR